MPTRFVVATMLVVTGIMQATCATAQDRANLRTAFVRAKVVGSAISDIALDPTGHSRFGQVFARTLRPVGWTETADTRARTTGSSTVVGPLRVWKDQPIEVAEGSQTSVPEMLKPGHTIGQSFHVPERGEFGAVSVKLPTWNSTTSGVTLSLVKDGKTIARRTARNVGDNSWQEIRAEAPCGPGDYVVELSDPVGTIGWWSGSQDLLRGSTALRDGQPIDADRTLRVAARAEVGIGTIRYALVGPVLTISADVKVTGIASPPTQVGWEWTTSWTQAGYDCSAKSGTVFSRFLTDTQRYMPVEQLKRRSTAGLSFTGCNRIDMKGVRDADVCLTGRNLGLAWTMAPHEMTLQLTCGAARTREGSHSAWSIEASSPSEAIPTLFPRFALSDHALERDLNRFFWERAFTYPGPAGPAAWFDMMAPVRCWYAGPQRDGEMSAARDYPITPEGYIYTWGGTSIGWPFPGPPYDTRHFDTNARYISAVERYYQWTGDMKFLRSQAERVHRAMNYQTSVLHGSEGAIVAASKDVTGRHKGVGDNYWDILPFGHLDAYADLAFYRSLGAMEHIERALGSAKAADYASLRVTAKRRFNELFWDEAKGRYIGCIDVDGARHDYGFTFVNLEAMAAGLADAAQVRRIYHWMETEPTSTGKADTYSKWVFAPRANTVHNPMWGDSAPVAERNNPVSPWWHFGWLGTPYGEQCQDGGAILFTSFYDLMARTNLIGVENGWRRFMEIVQRYRMPDRLCGGPPLSRGEIPQQENPGSVGLDLPFPESGMVPCYMLYGVMGIDAIPEGLRIAPHLPQALTYAEVSPLSWHGYRLRVRVTRSTVTVTGANRRGVAVRIRRALPKAGLVLTEKELRRAATRPRP